MKFTIQVNSSPFASHGGLSAVRFIETALLMNHQIDRVFFYKEGIYHAFKYVTPPDDELQLTKKWSELAERHRLDLVVCISAAQRRGLLSSDEAKRRGKLDDDVASGFRIGGLGQLVEGMLSSDRFIEFA
ncbi:sulfurtransferase complex subunit TusD [Methylomarinum vadi]|uniref:sulfurtransferase complex subunit TusD n=1 Tax=Methylomarinum vadi TaxID=438855 RepID=UPI0004DF5388|nr:sulfurtransferase complex subunit TusD [Methylomarinum vadi]